MINSYKWIILLFFIFISCKSTDKRIADYEEENKTISFSSGDSFTFETNNSNIICLAFLNNFQDSIVVLKNNKIVLGFNRNDSLSYKDMEHEKIFKSIELKDKNKKNKIDILLINERKKISFDLINNKNLYLISRYNKSWYITVWDKN
jgi:hypothetical protein